MLRHLYVRDFVIVDCLEMEFSAGFGALTGETGAGKSILVDALSRVLGGRADPTDVRQGCAKAEISAEFSPPRPGALADWLAANDFDAGNCLLRRVIEANGRSRGYINGTPATLGQLREVAGHLADIHGQHAHHSLLQGAAQRALLDALTGQPERVAEVATRFAAWQRIRVARMTAQQHAEAHAREREMLDWQLREVGELGFDAASWAETAVEHKRLAHAVSLQTGVAEALESLAEGELAATWQVERLAARMRQLVDYDPSLKNTLETIEEAQIQLQETAHALRQYRDRLEIDPERLHELDKRIRAVQDTARKYRVVPEELPRLLAAWGARRIELETLQDADRLAAQEAQARQEYETAAGKLSQARRKAATALASAVTEALADLAMPGGRFEVVLEKLPEGTAHGLERVEFQVLTHAGQIPGPLAKIASGGELSRIGLAIQVFASSVGEIPTLIFDEVDVGIGGSVAEIVGRLLRQLGQDRQVLCITHLPQVAAQADWQWSVARETVGEGVLSRVTPLDRAGRVEEIARMLGGVRITATTRRHAREMLGYETAP